MSKRKRETVEEIDETENISVNAYQTLVGTIAKARLPKRRRRELKNFEGNQQVTADDDDELEDNSDHEVESDGSHDENDVTNDDTHINKDPFSLHVSFDVDPCLTELDKNITTTSFQYHNDPVLGKVGIVSLLSGVGGLPCQLKGNSLIDHYVRQKMCKTWTAVNKKLSRTHDQQLTPLQAKLFAILNNYQDLLYTNRTFENCEEIRNVYLLHALNHVLKTRSRVLKHNSRLLRASQEGKEVSVELRDQGLTRPKVLILLPFRESALCVVNTMSKLLIEEGQGQVRYRKRFQEEYGPDSSEKEPANKPDSWYKIFAGNIDDCFRLGIAVTSKQLKLFSEFYHSDIVIASPLGLRTIIGGEGDKSQDYDYLSSIEIVICDQLDVMLMQNWEHLQHIFEHMNLQPRESHDVDFSRVRMWCINSHSKYYRQTLLFSSFPAAELNSLFNSHCFNYHGKVKISVPEYTGSICQVTSHIPQTFRRVDCSTYSELPDVRFKFFIEEILPHHSSPLMAQTAIFIASYPDFVRLRNYMSREEKSFTQICEYTKQSDLSRARSKFFHGKKHFILLTERMYYFHRLRIRGIHHIIFYSMPHNADFYSEILNNIEAQDTSSPMCTVLYSKYEALQLARVVGTRRAQVMCQSHELLHMMVTHNRT